MAVASCATSRGVLQSPVLASLSAQQALMDRSALEMGYVGNKLLYKNQMHDLGNKMNPSDK